VPYPPSPPTIDAIPEFLLTTRAPSIDVFIYMKLGRWDVHLVELEFDKGISSRIWRYACGDAVALHSFDTRYLVWTRLTEWLTTV
jgi:hypothetical protein